MARWIEHLVEPRRLILEWRPPPHVLHRARWAVGDLSWTESGSEFRYFEEHELFALNNGKTLEALKEAGFVGVVSRVVV